MNYEIAVKPKLYVYYVTMNYMYSSLLTDNHQDIKPKTSDLQRGQNLTCK